jgi:hypothetical protein
MAFGRGVGGRRPGFQGAEFMTASCKAVQTGGVGVDCCAASLRHLRSPASTNA